tara:strand:- start:374 stop:1177 length:804 start_codon:yes stop_codon:yes gene_type:complete
MRIVLFYVIFFFTILIGQTEIVILSSNVGTEIDLDENRFYKIFPKEKGLKSAQIIRLSKEEYKIVFEKRAKRNKTGNTNKTKIISRDEFEALKMMVDSKPIFKKKDRVAMYAGMDFLRAEKILEEIPKPQYVVLRRSGGKKLKGTLSRFENNTIYVQTSTMIESVSLDNVDLLSYRSELANYEILRPYVYIFSGLSGFSLAHLYNKQRPAVYNTYGIARKDLVRYRQIFGSVIGLIFSSEVFDAVATLLTPTKTIILSEAEYDNKNK